ncbi:glycosyltransferase [Bacteroides finegoldii]|uniref:glycosyltransferase n=1 Tax=Bacteroides finegoldii TaxID=338188 RepID=UPI00189C9EE6|nr:glycosyltransferase [Bacteroides finegoldii]
MKKIIGVILCRLRQLFISGKYDTYVSEISKKLPWVYISYISESFYRIEDKQYFNSHQNIRESIEIVRLFNEKGYNVYVQSPKSRRKLPHIDFKIVFGIEPNFIRAVKKYSSAKMIYYATGAFIDHQNNQVRQMTDYINNTYNSNLRYVRLIPEHRSAYLADYIVQIGSNYTIETYPEELRKKIRIVRQSTQTVISSPPVQYAEENEFFFMSSTGNALKGLSLLVEYFSQHQDLRLNIVGTIEDNFKSAMSSLFTSNIVFWGYLDINGIVFSDLSKRCNFVIYPSGSEGMPGAVLNSMKKGLIPITTRWAAVDNIEELGFLMPSWSIDGIDSGVKWALSLSKDQVKKLRLKSFEFVKDNFTIENFSNDLSKFIDSLKNECSF